MKKVLTFYIRQLFLGSCRIMAILSWFSQHLSARFEAMFSSHLLAINFNDHVSSGQFAHNPIPRGRTSPQNMLFSQLQLKSDYRTCHNWEKIMCNNGIKEMKKIDRRGFQHDGGFKAKNTLGTRMGWHQARKKENRKRSRNDVSCFSIFSFLWFF